FARFSSYARSRCGVARVSGAKHEQTSGVQFRRHVRELFLDQLVLTKQTSELLACGGVTECFIERAERHAACSRADTRAKRIKRLHCQTKAIALVADHIFRRHAAVVERDLADRMR